MNRQALAFSPVQRYLEQLHEELLGTTGGEVASYIPELTHADPAWLGIALVTVDGHVYQVGDSRQPFTIQSISKAITYGLALEDRGLDHVVSRVGVEPSGEAFNSISLEPETGRPLNPMINAGAIATTGMVEAKPGEDPMSRILQTFARYTGRPMELDERVYRSESETGHRNRAIAHLLFGHGIVDRAPEEVLDLYFRQCSILVNARDLAAMGACLANNGVNPVTGVVALKSRHVEKVLSVMSTCGMYDFSGGWIFNVGMPAKSGVGGGIMAVLPGQFGLGVFSPALDEKGNSVRGIQACKRLSSDFGLHLFNVARSTSSSVLRRVYDSAKFASRRRRSANELELLATQGRRVRIYELQGELLFGNTESLTLDMLAALSEADYLVIDLRRVIACDMASILLLSGLCERVAAQARALFFTDCTQLYRLKKHLQSLTLTQQPGWLYFEDTDRAVEWCENRLLAAADLAPAVEPVGTDLCRQYLCAGMTPEEIQSLRGAGQDRRFPAGTRIVCAGDEADSLYFILSGQVEVLVNTEAGYQLRVTTLGPGTVFGEVALVGRKRRTADVVAATDAVCLEVRFDMLPDAARTRMLMNMAGYFANKIEQDTELMQHLG
jgi:glutaminase